MLMRVRVEIEGEDGEPSAVCEHMSVEIPSRVRVASLMGYCLRGIDNVIEMGSQVEVVDSFATSAFQDEHED